MAIGAGHDDFRNPSENISRGTTLFDRRLNIPGGTATIRPIGLREARAEAGRRRQSGLTGTARKLPPLTSVEGQPHGTLIHQGRDQAKHSQVDSPDTLQALLPVDHAVGQLREECVHLLADPQEWRPGWHRLRSLRIRVRTFSTSTAESCRALRQPSCACISFSWTVRPPSL